MVWIENFLKGDAFNEGLRAPVWPFKPVNKNDEHYTAGKALYQQRCQGCHLPVVSDPALNSHFAPIAYIQNGKTKYTEEKVLDLIIVGQKDIGTDPAQGNVLVTRTVNTSGNNQGTLDQKTTGLGLDGVICGQNPQQVYENLLFGGENKVELVDGITVNDGGELSFAFALGAIVNQTNEAWFDANFITDPALKDKFRGGRPNCLQAGRGL